MKERDIRAFFKALDKRLNIPIQVVLTGGAAAILRGVNRATYDIDFELRVKGAKARDLKAWDKVCRAIAETQRETRIAPQYDADIGRWGLINFPTKQTEPYAKVGKIDIRLLEPGIWAIRKLTRYLESDVHDLRIGLKNAKTNPQAMARLWGVALGISPLSSSSSMFSRQVNSFFEIYAEEIWGPGTDPASLQERFRESSRHTRQRQMKRESKRKR